MRKPTYCEVRASRLQFVPVNIHKTNILNKSNQLSRVTGDMAKVQYFQMPNLDHSSQPRVIVECRSRCSGLSRYLLSNLIVSYVSFNSEGPFKVKVVLVQLQQEYNQYKEGIDHKERKNRRISQFFQISGYTGLKLGEDYHHEYLV